jgi:hypothetical protein
MLYMKTYECLCTKFRRILLCIFIYRYTMFRINIREKNETHLS